jgi:hypothetical protein
MYVGFSARVRFFVIAYPFQYRLWDPDKAVEDYYGRIRDHEKHYETVDELTWPCIRIINV